MRRVGKRSNSEDIGSWDLPPPKRVRVESSRKTGPTVWSRITSGFGGLFSTVRRWFSRSHDSNSRPPPMTETSLPSPPHSTSSPPPITPALHPPSRSATAPSPPLPPSKILPHPPSFTATQSPVQPTPTLPRVSARQEDRPLPQATRYRYDSEEVRSGGYGLWTQKRKEASSREQMRPRERWSQIFSSCSPPSTTQCSPSPFISPQPTLSSHPPLVTLHPPHPSSPPDSGAPENIGPKLRSMALSPRSPPSQPRSAFPARTRSLTGPALYHSLPHSPPLSPLPSSDAVQRKKWVESVKADHTHSLSQHRAAVELELRRLAMCRERRFRAEDSRVRHLQESVQNMSLISQLGSEEEEEEEEEEEMMCLTEQQEQKVKSVLSRGPGLEVLSQKFNISIKRDDVWTLAGLNWLNDEVINFYMNLIVERGRSEGSLCSVHAMSSFFYPKLCDMGYSGVRRWTKKVDIFSLDLVLYPIHLGSHWCLAAIHNRQHTITYYDSLGGRGRHCLDILRQYLMAEHRDKKKAELCLEGWRDMVAEDIPLQKNGSDCGVFTCMYARCLASNSAFTFSQEDMPQIRRHIICELLEQRLF